MRTIKSPQGFCYPIPITCQSCGKYKAVVCIQKFAPITTREIGWTEAADNVFYCSSCNMLGR